MTIKYKRLDCQRGGYPHEIILELGKLLVVLVGNKVEVPEIVQRERKVVVTILRYSPPLLAIGKPPHPLRSPILT